MRLAGAGARSAGPRGAEVSSDQRDRLVDDVIGREESWSLPETPALDKARLPVVSVARVLQSVKGRRIDEDSGEGLSAAPDTAGSHDCGAPAPASTGRG